MILKKSALQVSPSDLLALIENEVPEGRHIEYKESLPSSKDADKREFLADISSFANTNGGHIVFGCKEKRIDGEKTGLPELFCGLPDVSSDSELNRLNQIIRTGIEPRIQGIEIAPLIIPDDTLVLVISIPKSFQAPHMVTFGNLSRFYGRSSAGKFQLDVTEIRRGFIAASSLEENIRLFSLDRIMKIMSGQTPVPLKTGITAVLHLLPLSSFLENQEFSIEGLKSDNRLQPMYTDSWGSRFNFDGWLVHSSYSEQNPATSYVQIFRNGSVEAAMSYGPDRDHLIPSLQLEDMILQGKRPPCNVLQISGLSLEAAGLGMFCRLPRQRQQSLIVGFAVYADAFNDISEVVND